MKKILFGVVAAAAATILMAGCGTTGAVAANAAGTTNSGTATAKTAEELSPSRQVYEWDGMDVGVEKSPKWLKDAMLDNYSTYIAAYNKKESDAYRNSEGYGADLRSATMRADMAYARKIAKELRQSIKYYSAEQARAGNLSEQTRQAIEEVTHSQSNADITGHQKATEFWQRIISTDPITGEKTSQYIVYQVYQIPASTWAQTTAKYVRDVLGAIPETLSPEQDFVKGLVGQMMADARNQKVKTPEEAKKTATLSVKVANAAAAESTPEKQQEAAEKVVAEAMKEDNVKVGSDVAKTVYDSGNSTYSSAITVTGADQEWAVAQQLALETLYPDLD